MPTTNPRVSITLAASDLAILDRFAAASGTPRATVLAELVAVVLPQLNEAAALMEMAKAAPVEVQRNLAESVRRATEDATVHLAEAHRAYGGLMDKMQLQLHLPAKGRRRKGAASAAPAATGPRRGPQTPTY